MKIKEGYVLREVAGQIIVVPTKSAALDFNGVITLNDSGHLLWNLLSKETTVAELVAELINNYEVSFTEAEKDVLEFIETLKSNNILENEK